MPMIYSANSSSVLVDGDALEGLQSLAFRVVTEREDVRAVGSDERIDVSFGLRTVQIEIVVRSASDKLNQLLDDRVQFQIVANLAKAKGMTTTAKTYAFDQCFVEAKSFAMESGGTAATTYVCTATRMRIE